MEDELDQERSMSAAISSLLDSEESRYESQAKLLLELGSLVHSSNGIEIRYWIIDRNLHYKIPANGAGISMESETLLPSNPESQLDAVIFYFAECEAFTRS